MDPRDLSVVLSDPDEPNNVDGNEDDEGSSSNDDNGDHSVRKSHQETLAVRKISSAAKVQHRGSVFASQPQGSSSKRRLFAPSESSDEEHSSQKPKKQHKVTRYLHFTRLLIQSLKVSQHRMKGSRQARQSPSQRPRTRASPSRSTSPGPDVARVPSMTSIDYWKNYGDPYTWQYMNFALLYFRIRLLGQNAFPDGATLREMVRAAWEASYEHGMRHVEPTIDMLKTVRFLHIFSYTD